MFRVNELVEYYKSINEKDKTISKSDEKLKPKKFKLQKIKMKSNERNFYRKNPNVVGLESESEEEDEKDTEEEEEEESDEHVVKEEVQNEIVETLEQEKDPALKIETEKIVCESTKKEENEVEANFVKTTYVPVLRSEEIQKARLDLPILQEEYAVMEAIMYKPVVIICGETGSGKTTQVPQFLYESGFTMNNRMIGVTEPRRVAAISMSQRVGYELGLSSAEVSYQIRYEGNVTDKTKIKFMTDGVLMKEIRHDFLLRKYSAIIIDEAHERSLYSDILIGFLSRLVQTRQQRGDPLKLIIMSATLRVEDFTANNRLFKVAPPVIKIDSRQFPVNVHFTKQTRPNYMREAFKKAVKVHATLPDGGILVFVTGRQEVKRLCRQLREKFPLKDGQKNTAKEEKVNKEEEKEEDDICDEKQSKKKDANDVNQITTSSISLDRYSVTPNDEEDVDRVVDDFDYIDNEDEEQDVSDEDENEDDEDEDILGSVSTDMPLYCLPLYSTLPSHKQARVFRKPPPGCRLCVIATNVAETSLTIPDIKYVIDTGKVNSSLNNFVVEVSNIFCFC